MKFYSQLPIFAATALIALPLASCESQSDAYARLTNEMLDKMEEVSNILASVTDKETADAAASKIAPLLEDINELKVDLDKLGEPDSETTATIEKKLKPRAEVVAAAFLKSSFPLAFKDFYGSTALENAFKALKPDDKGK